MNFKFDISLYDWLKVFSIQKSRPFREKEFVSFLQKQINSSLNEKEIVNQIKLLISKGMLTESSGTIYISKVFSELDKLYSHVLQDARMRTELEIRSICDSTRWQTLIGEDVRFIKIGKQHWILSSWEIVNDDVYEFLSMIPERKDNYLDVLAEFETNEGAFSKIFLVNVDKRFIIEQGYIMAVEEEQDVILDEKDNIAERTIRAANVSTDMPKTMSRDNVVANDNSYSSSRNAEDNYKDSTLLNKIRKMFVRIFRFNKG